VQTKQKWALKLLMALGAVSCGGSTQPGDSYQGFIDATQLDSKFQTPSTCGSNSRDKCPYQPMTGNAGTPFAFYNLGFLAKDDKSPVQVKDTSTQRLSLPVSVVKATTYDFTEGCKTGKEFDARTDAYREDVQYAVFDTLPLSSNPAPVLPLVKAKPWMGVSQYTCNAIKNAQSLTDGDFGGAAAEGESIALRAIIDVTVDFKAPTTSPTYAPAPGWYRGLQFVYLDGGTVPTEDFTVDAAGTPTTVTVLKTMDGVLVKPSSGTAPKPTDSNAVLVFQAKPGEANWSPVVRVREFTAPGATKPADYKSLCYDPSAGGCPAGTIDMTKLPVDKATGLLFVVGSAQ
jgi:hypothetical protein